MAKTIEAWDDPDFAAGKRTRADHRDVPFRIGDEVAGTLDLTGEHLRQLVEHNARWIALLQAAPPEAGQGRFRRAPVGASPGNPDARKYWRDIRRFMKATGRGDQVLRPGWTPADGSKNKFARPSQAVLDEFAAWDAEGRPPLDTWQWPRPGRQRAS